MTVAPDTLQVDAVAQVLLALSRKDVGCLRQACRHYREAVDRTLTSLTIHACPSDGDCVDAISRRFPSITSLSFCGGSPAKAWPADIEATLAPLQVLLAQRPNLRSLALPCDLVLALGRQEWARCLHYTIPSSRAGSPSSAGSFAAIAAAPPHPHYAGWYGTNAAAISGMHHLVMWLPGWLFSNPGLQHLSISSPSSRRDTEPLTCLWLNPAAATSLTSLRLQGSNLALLPPMLQSLTGLRSLSLAHCGLLRLESQVSRLASLTQLDLAHNELGGVPDELGELARLARLGLHGNRLCRLPDRFAALQQLRDLDVSNNQLVEVPTCLGALTGLTSLDLSHNWISGGRGLAGAMRGWRGLRRLVLRNVSDKHDALVLPGVVTQLVELTELDLGDNWALEAASLDALAACRSLTALTVELPAGQVLPAALASLQAAAAQELPARRESASR